MNDRDLDTADPQTLRNARFLQKALQAFTLATGIQAESEGAKTPLQKNRRVEAIVRFRGEKGDWVRFAAETKRVDRLAALGAVQAQFGNDDLHHPVLLVAPYVAPRMAEQCRRIRLHFIDTAGNAFIEAPGLFVLVKGQPRPEAEPGLLQGKATTATALRVTFVLLCDERLLNATYRQIAKAANVALGTIGWTFLELDARGFTTGGKHKDNPRILLERRKLIDEWVTNFPIKLRPKLDVQRFTAGDKTWWQDVNITKYDGWWGGEIAADRYTNDLRPATATIYMAPATRTRNLGRLIADKHLRPDPNGEIEVLDQFWDLVPQTEAANAPRGVVPPLLAYADLLATNDPRNLAVATKLHGTWLLHDEIAP